MFKRRSYAKTPKHFFEDLKKLRKSIEKCLIESSRSEGRDSGKDVYTALQYFKEAESLLFQLITILIPSPAGPSAN